MLQRLRLTSLLLALVSATCCRAQRPLHSMHLKGNGRQVLRQAFALFAVDLDFVELSLHATNPLRVDLDDASLATVKELLGAMTHTFFVEGKEHRLLVVPDDAAHRAIYPTTATETVIIPNMRSGDPEQTEAVTSLLKEIFQIKGLVVSGNQVTVRAERQDLPQIEHTLQNLFTPAPEILLEVSVYSVSRSLEREAGVQPPQQITVFNLRSEAESLITSNASIVQELISAGTVAAGDWYGIALALLTGGYGSGSILADPFVAIGGGSTAFGLNFDSMEAALMLSRSSSQQIETQTLRVANGDVGKLIVGSRYPIETATTAAVGSSASRTTPSIEYENLGLTLEARPVIRSGGEVLLQLHEVVRSLGSGTLNNIPEIQNQEFLSSLSVPPGATTVMVSNVSSSQARAVEGFGALVPSSRDAQQQMSQLVITVRAHLVRASAHSKE